MADRFWVGGNGPWSSASTANWAATSGGAAGASVPTAADDVHFDTNSAASVVTLTGAGLVCNNLICEGTFTGRFAGSGTLAISGNVTMLAGMGTNSHSGAWTFNATSAKVITSGGKGFGPVVFDGVAGQWTLAGTMICAGTITLTNGAFISAGFAVSAAALNSNNANVRTLNVDGSTVTLGANTTMIQFGSSTSNLTFSATGTAWVFSTGTATNHACNFGGMTLNMGTSITIAGTGTGTFTFAFGSFTVSSFAVTRTAQIRVIFSAPNTFTFTSASNPFSMNGTGSKINAIASSSPGQQTVFVASGVTGVELQYVTMIDVNASPAGAWIVRGLLSASSNLGNNTGVAFSPRLLPGTRATIIRAYSDVVLAKSPRAYWKLNEASGNFADSSGNGNTLVSALAAGSYQQDSLTPPAGQYAVNMLVAAALGTIADNASLSITGAMTLECWIKRPNTTVGTYGLMSKGNLSGGTNNLAYSLFIDGNNATTCRISGDGAAIVGVSSPNGQVNDTNTHHVAVVYRPSTSLEVYVDGWRRGRTTASVPAALFDSGASFRLGAGATNADAATVPFTNGTMDECAVYATALTAQQIYDHYLRGSLSRTAVATVRTQVI